MIINKDSKTIMRNYLLSARSLLVPLRKALLYLSFLFFYTAPCLGQVTAEQTAQIDSLKQVIAIAEHDTVKFNAYRDIGLIYYTQRKYTEALPHFEEALTIGKAIEAPSKISFCLDKIGYVYSRTGDFPKAKDYFIRSLDIRKAEGTKAEIGESIYNVGYIYSQLGDNLKSKEYLLESLAIVEEFGNQSHIATILYNLSWVYADLGDYLNALKCNLRSLELREELDESLKVIYSLIALGRLYANNGMPAKAIECYNRGMSICEELGDQLMASEFLNSMGYIYDKLGELSKANDNFIQSYEIRKTVGQKYDVAGSLFNLGYINRKLGNYAKALDYQKHSLALRKEMGNTEWIIQSLNSIGNIHKDQGNYKKAIRHYKESLALAGQTNIKSLTIHSLNLVAEIYRYQGNYLKALDNNNKALALAKGTGNLTLNRDSYYSLYQTYKGIKNHSSALQMYEQYTAARDSLKWEENQRDVIRQEYKYKYEKEALADSLQNVEAKKLTDAQLTAQKAQNTQQRQQSIFIGIGLLSLLLLSGFSFYRRRATLQKELELEQKEALRLKELDQFKSKLYTNLTHEFRTPLTVILGMAEKLQVTPKKFIYEAPPIIERNGKNLLRIINQLLDLSKLENNSFTLQIRQGEIISYLRYILESFHSYANGNNLSLRFFSNVETLQMDYDEEQLKQVMTNLISNAIKFTPAGGEVGVRVLKEEDRLKIDVKDNGIGIPEKALPLIFDRFYQVDGSSLRAHGGTGIGLAHTKELLRLMEGEISVESNLKQEGSDEKSGSVFTMSLPIRNNAPLLENSPTLQSTTSLSTPKKTITPVKTTVPNEKELPTVLIIEDNPDVVVYLKSCLEKEYQIEIAYNGTIGIEKAIEMTPDLIISDVMMPGKDGFEVCNTLKTDERTSHIPIVLLTAKADLSSKLEGLERGADAYLAKPFHQKELDIRLKKLLKGRKNMSTYFKKQYLNTTELVQTQLSEEHSKSLIYEDVFIKKINAILDENMQHEDFGLPQLRQKIRMSRSQFFRKIKALTNTAPSEYIRSYRLQRAKQLLENGDFNVAEAAYEVGFKDPSYFSKIFQEAFGHPPSDLKS